MGLATTGRRVELEERVFQVLVNLHDGSLVTATVAVIWSTEDCHHIAVLAPVITLLTIVREEIAMSVQLIRNGSAMVPLVVSENYLHNQLMGSCDQC